MNAEHI